MSCDHDPYDINFPQVRFGEDTGIIPISLKDATNWERQEILTAWRDSITAAENLAKGAAYFHEMLMDPYGKFALTGNVGSVNMGGDRQPAYTANQFVVAVTRLRHLVEGMNHRVAMERHRKPEIDVEYAIAHAEDEGS